jgi:hypothetical protein
MLVMFLCGNCSDVVVLRRINDQMMIGDAILVGMVPIYLLCLLLELSLEVLKEVRVEVLTLWRCQLYPIMSKSD